MDGPRWEPSWYPDPHGGGERWWDGDRWTDDVRGATTSERTTAPEAEAGGRSDGAWVLDLPRLHLQQSRVRWSNEPRYVVSDPWGGPILDVWERPFASGGRQHKAATLDGMAPGGDGVFRITRDPAICRPVQEAGAWPFPLVGIWAVFDGAGAAVAQARLAGGRFSQRWVVDVVGLPTHLTLKGDQVRARGRARPVLLGDQAVAVITLVSGWTAPDAYVIDVPGAPHGGPLGVAVAAIGVLYDQLFREASPTASHDSGLAVDPTAG